MAGIHRETAAERRRTGSAVLAGAAPRRGAHAALRKLRLVPVSEHAVLPAVSVGDIRMACGCAVRLVSNPVGVEAGSLRIGMPVEAVFEDVTSDVTLLKFKPRKEHQ